MYRQVRGGTEAMKTIPHVSPITEPYSGHKLKEITGSGIFATDEEDAALESGSANTASNNRTGLRMYQPSRPPSLHSLLKPIPKLTSHNLHFSLFPLSNPNYAPSRVSKYRALSPVGKTESVGSNDNSPQMDYLAEDVVFYKNTVRLVECSMFTSVAGLAYFLSNSLAIENYFGCFSPLSIVITSLRRGIIAGRKTMVATALLLPIVSGPVKALSAYAWFPGFHSGNFVERPK
ncbi:protein of unknown function DUF4057, partial [Dillenia turbinata]